MSKQTECIIPDCTNIPRTRGVCSTHREHLYEHGSVEVQRAVEEREHEQFLATETDWEYLTGEQRYAIERGVKDAYWENGTLQERDLENMLQEAWIWAATHKTEVLRIEKVSLLRERARSRSVDVHRTGWTEAQGMDYFEDFLRTDEEG